MSNPAKRNSCETHMGILLQKVVSLGRISAKSAELVKEEHKKFFHIVDQNQQLFSNFSFASDRIDCLFSKTMGSSSNQFANLWEFVKMILVLFHGQSAVERGFSVNKQLLVENLKTKSLVALQRIEDHTSVSESSPATIKVSTAMVKSVKEAYRRYQNELENKKKENEDT